MRITGVSLIRDGLDQALATIERGDKLVVWRLDRLGRSIPHDRYLLVVTTAGEEICWQMSNSPIHARADIKDASPETPLRWKDLAATNIPSDELMPAFLQWLKGKTL